MGAVAGVGVEALLALGLGALAGRADVHHRQPGLLGEREGAGVEGVGQLLVVLGDHAGAGAVGAVELDQLDPEALGDQGHRAVQLAGEAARDAAGPVGDLQIRHQPSSGLGLDGLGRRLGLVDRGVLLGLLALDVEVELDLVLLGVGVDPLHVVLGVAGQLGVDAGDQLRQRAHLAGADAADRRRDRLEQALDRAGPRRHLALAPRRVGLLQQQRLVQRALLLDDLGEGVLVAVAVVVVVDLVLVAGDPAQAHDLVHRRHALGAGVDAAEAVGAVVDAVRVVGEVVQALLGLGVARVADEAVGLGERGGADEVGVGLHREAGGDAGAALDAGHRLGHVDHRLGRDHVLALGRVALGQQPRGDPADLGPVGRLHVGDQVLDHRHVPHRLDDDRLAAAVLAVGEVARLADLGLAGEAGLAVDLHPAGAADRRPAGTAHRQRAVLVVLGLQQPVEDRERGVELDVEGLPVGALAFLGLEAADLERVVGHSSVHPTVPQ